MNDNIPTSDVLDAAADAIHLHGWGKGVDSWSGVAGAGLCLEGGIAAAVGIDIRVSGPGLMALTVCPAYVAVQEYLAHLLPEGFDEPWYFNDSIAETVDDVIAVLRAAAAVERVKEATAGYSSEDQPLPIEVAA